jgi:ABC-type phosphate/phosphonate transport system ATPase subunit
MAKTKSDFAQLAHSIVEKATGETLKPALPKNAAAVALGRLGGLKGGRARADTLSAEQRVSIARKAAKTRWSAKKSGSA